jgi:isopentenyldiphosphate isomerase
MNKIGRLRSLVPGLMPLLALIITELIWGITVGLIVAGAISILELFWYVVKYKRFEKRILFDIGIVLLFALAVILFEGHQLEQYKPLFVLLLLLLMSGVTAFSGYNIVLSSASRFFTKMRFGPFELWQMRMTMRRLFFFLLCYSIVYVFGMMMLDEFVVEFLGGNGLYIFFGLFMVVEIAVKKISAKKYSKEEWLPLVQNDGKVFGAAPRSIVHNGKERWLHPVVHLQVIHNGGVWLQKRPIHKLVQPGKWDTAVGGHPSANETIEESLKRETAEEIGVDLNSAVVLGQYVWESSIECELVFAFALNYNGKITPHPEELDGGKVWSVAEIEKNIGKNIFTENFEHEFGLYKDKLISYM